MRSPDKRTVFNLFFFFAFPMMLLHNACSLYGRKGGGGPCLKAMRIERIRVRLFIFSVCSRS